MTESPEKKSGKNQAIEKGIYTALLFLVLFILLRYSLLLSLIFASLGGISLSLIWQWWTSTEEIETKTKKSQKLFKKNPNLKEAQAKRKLEDRKKKKLNSQKKSLVFGFFSRKKNK